MSKIGQIRSSIRDFVWERDLAAMPRWKAWVYRWIRLFYAILRDVTEGRFTMRATSLVYTTLIALVPLLAFAFSILQAFGVHNQMQPVLARFFEPLGDRGLEISTSIITFVEEARVGVIGTVGLLVLIFTGFSLLRKVEQFFNKAWHTSQRRSYKQRLVDYLSVAIFGPVLLVATIALTASVTSISFINQYADVPVLGGVIGGAGRYPKDAALPWILVSMLPRLSDDPDRLFDDAMAFLRAQPAQAPRLHYMAFFDWLADLPNRIGVVREDDRRLLNRIQRLIGGK